MKRILIALAVLLATLTLTILWWAYSLSRQMHERLSRGWFLPPVEFYAAGVEFRRGDFVQLEALSKALDKHGFRQRSHGQALRAGDYVLGPQDWCQQLVGDLAPEAETCVIFHSQSERSEQAVLIMDLSGQIIDLRHGTESLRTTNITLQARLFAQFYDRQPILRQIKALGEIPLLCLQATTAIEDNQFLEHSGVSFSGMLRAVVRNLRAGRWAEGGSTITQQLVKNYFLTHEKTLTRKLTEQMMATILEIQVGKDAILEKYLNEIYMGQSGPFQVRGFASASRHYFNQDLEKLQLAECALLAAVINNPGKYNPWSHPELAQQRRSLVLSKMRESGMISTEDETQANASALPLRPPRYLRDPAPYFVMQTFREVEALGLPIDQGLKIFTTLVPELQDKAQASISEGLPDIEARVKQLHKDKMPTSAPLQAALLSVDLTNMSVRALVGGREYKQTQFNRVKDSFRQVGSVIKPFVYLAALANSDTKYGPLSPLDDTPYMYKFERQKWSPQNYDHKFRGTVPLFYALAQSLNVPTARLGIDVGLENLVDMLKAFHLEKEVVPRPALTLGAVELTPWDVAQLYGTLARFGSYLPLTMIKRIEALSGDVLYESDPAEQSVARAATVATLISMMKNSSLIGTSRVLPAMGLSYPIAGKTGTTSDSRDAWFVGFTPKTLTIVWVGYDDNTPHKLTGASGALPLWAKFMAQAVPSGEGDFAWPENVQRLVVNKNELLEKFPGLRELENWPEELQFIVPEHTFDQ